MTVRRGQPIDLFDAHTAVTQRLAHVGMPVDQIGPLADSIGPNTRAVQLLLEIALHRTVAVIVKQPTAFDHGNRR